MVALQAVLLKVVGESGWKLRIDKKSHILISWRLRSLKHRMIGLSRREFEDGADVFGFKIREVSEDFHFLYPGGQEVKDVFNADSQPPDTGAASTLQGVDGNPIQVLHIKILHSEFTMNEMRLLKAKTSSR